LRSENEKVKRDQQRKNGKTRMFQLKKISKM